MVWRGCLSPEQQQEGRDRGEVSRFSFAPLSAPQNSLVLKEELK